MAPRCRGDVARVAHLHPPGAVLGQPRLPGGYGDGQADDRLPVCVFELGEPGMPHAKTAEEYTCAEVRAETWPQLNAALNEHDRTVLDDPTSTPGPWARLGRFGREALPIRTLYRPPEMEPLARVDEARFRLGPPDTFEMG